MKKIKHTPGPWHIDKTGVIYGPPENDSESSCFVADVSLDIVALEMTDREAANAKLIAAAPEMLDALFSIRDLMLKAGLVNYDNAPIYNKATEAIKKASE